MASISTMVLLDKKYLCKNCGACGAFVHRKGFQKKYKNPQEIIEYALLFRDLSTRKISRLVALKFGVKVSHVAVSKWLKTDAKSGFN